MKVNKRENKIDFFADGMLSLSLLVVAYRLVRQDLFWVHPHYFYDILPQSLANGDSLKLRDLIDVMQPRQEFEVRTRFVNYLVLALDQKIRAAIFDHVFIPTNILPITTTLNVISTIILYISLKSLFQNISIAKIGISVYLLSIGFYSLYGNVYMAAKPVTNFLIIMSIWLLVRVSNRRISQRMFMLLNTFVLLVGLYTDEVIFIALLGYFMVFASNVFSPRLEKQKSLNAQKGKVRAQDFVQNELSQWTAGFRCACLSFFLAISLWVFSVTFVVPKITRRYFGWDFPFWKFNLNTKNDINFGGGFPAGTEVDIPFLVRNLASNAYNIVSFQIFPYSFYQIDGRTDLEYGNPNSLYRFGNLNFVSIVSFVLLLSLFIWLVKSKKSYSSGISFLIFLGGIGFFTVLQIKHVPQIAGYIYGASISVFFTFFIANLFCDFYKSKLSQNFMIALMTLIVVTQIVNGQEFNKRWDSFHRNWSYSALQQIQSLENSKLGNGINSNILINPSPLEDWRIWRAYRSGEIDNYLQLNPISLKGMAFLLELRLGEYSSKLNDGGYHCDIGGLSLACLGYRGK